ncbi:MAG: hypothetical protein N3G21_10815 [Candidatus Hydrogenedentes bacterium]|nr:hypothetical protein [Candidatus Hydrogenedentota bacterium]
MISKDLLDILVCPETKQKLELINDELLNELNEAIRKGKLVNKGGEVLKETLNGALIRTDRKVVYPIINDLPYLRIGDGIEIDKILNK